MKKDNSNKEKDNNNLPFKQFNFKFNFYWIYGIIFALLIGYQLMNNSDIASNKLSQNEFTEILNENDIEKILIVNGDIAQLTIKKKRWTPRKSTESTRTRPFSGRPPLCIYMILGTSKTLRTACPALGRNTAWTSTRTIPHAPVSSIRFWCGFRSSSL